MSQKRKILVTSALPYANGDIHIGHLVEYLQTDFWVRFQKMRGHECHYMCADDTHGTPIMISAKQQGITPEELVDKFHKKHLQDFTDFQIEFDNYYTTNSPENKELSEFIFNKMEKNGHIEEKAIKQLYCDHDKMFLPDRFVKGTCPKCSSENQYGDSCDVCSSHYDPTELKDAKCVYCGNNPKEKQSIHVFFKLNDFKKFLKDWINDHSTPEVKNKLDEWLKEDLRNWDISRDAPYFGFEIPGRPGKFFYVWVDAPIGYIASTKNWSEKNERSYEEFWKSEESELYHFIGKDIVYFHTLFWPAMLENAGFRTPTNVFVHGFLTVNGEKMSKSKGTFINARTYLNHLSPDYLRYYYACKMNSGIDDVDLSLEDFVLRVNSDMIGKLTNIASRSISMLKKIELRLTTIDPTAKDLIKNIQNASEAIAKNYEARNFSRVMVEIRELADEVNKYVDTSEPWKVIKTDKVKAAQILTTATNAFRLLVIYLAPVLPVYANKVSAMLKCNKFTWEDSQKILENHTINEYEHLATRVDKKDVDKIIGETADTGPKKPPLGHKPQAISPKIIDFTDFSKVDLRVAKIIEAENIKEADKLLKLKVSIGELGERQIIAGIKKYYEPAKLVSRHIIVVANLAPRKMKFGISEGMLLAASGDEGLFLLGPDLGAVEGMKVS